MIAPMQRLHQVKIITTFPPKGQAQHLLINLFLPTHWQKIVRCFIVVARPYFSENYIYWKILATQTVRLAGRTQDSISVAVLPGYNLDGYHMVVRNSKLGRFTGACESKSKTCTTTGLSKGYLYDIWVRSCSNSDQVICKLEAKPIKVGIIPDRKSSPPLFLRIVYRVYIICSNFSPEGTWNHLGKHTPIEYNIHPC